MKNSIFRLSTRFLIQRKSPAKILLFSSVIRFVLIETFYNKNPKLTKQFFKFVVWKTKPEWKEKLRETISRIKNEKKPL